jgi:Holliday junction resolvase|tara:strand:- start:1180 stop:1488 length:309 start_codon:yes stop_codon:yes gene_type:complete
MTPEKKVKNKVVAILKEHKTYYFYPMTGGYGRSGVPDIVGCYRGIFFGIECKAKGNKPTALQNKNLSDIMGAGGMAMVVNENNISDVYVMLRSIRDEETAYE